MKIDWRFVLVLVAALVTIIALKTQTENLDGEVEEETEETEETEEPEKTEKTEETEEPEPAYPDVSGFVAELNGVNGSIKFTDLAMIEDLMREVKVTSDPKSYVHCMENCGPDVMSNPEMKDQQKKCKVGCDQFLSGACKVGCAVNADAPECEGFCSSYLE